MQTQLRTSERIIKITDSQFDLISKDHNSTFWYGLNYKWHDETHILDLDNQIIHPFEVVETSLEKQTYTKEEVLSALRGLTKNEDLIIKDTYIDFGANWKEPQIINKKNSRNGYQVIYPCDITDFANDEFTFEQILKYAQKIRDYDMLK